MKYIITTICVSQVIRDHFLGIEQVYIEKKNRNMRLRQDMDTILSWDAHMMMVFWISKL